MKPKNILLRDINNFYNPKSIKSNLKKLEEGKILIKEKYVKKMIIPIVVKGNVYGHLFTWAINTQLGGFDLAIIESAATIIVLEVIEKISIKEIEIRYRSEFLEDLISIDEKRKKKALERAHFFNLNKDNIYVAKLMSFKFKLREGNQEEEYFLDYVEKNISKIISTIESTVKFVGLKGVVTSKMNEIQILLGFQNESTADKQLEDFNNILNKKISEKFENIEFKISVGRQSKGLSNVNKSFSDALKTIRIAILIINRNIVNFDELGIFEILCQDFLNDELEDFYNSTLKLLVDYDEKRSTELVKTLEAYFRHSGNLRKIPDALYTHYNTILYRINRIKDITGMDLDDENNRLDLEIALKTKDLIIK
ncbi:PucR family transcriptional regulator [Anaerosalibacter massiliensis]|uniref:Helix-turn-helix domain-containing protein n=1 Tax=Anaerosalibacter massiliensis TaxID=1347392 RepID=A0A9X2ML21_9FIRM|nr:PucR family transcriptional regulator [Anaerosalibacter massiliensis]MCR2045461.1 helix-turn-helix domain-containing protein [Anaerosalibacter massiliensis]